MELYDCVVYHRLWCLTGVQNVLLTCGKFVQRAFGRKTYFSTVFHPQINGQTKGVNLMLEDML